MGITKRATDPAGATAPRWRAGMDAAIGVGQRALDRTREAVTEARRQGPQATGLAILRGLGELLRWGIIPLVAGLLGSLTAVIVMGALRLAWGSPTLPELLAERILPLINVYTFINLLVAYGKTKPLISALQGLLVIGVLLGPAYQLVARAPLRVRGALPARRAWLTAAGFTLALEALTVILFWPVLFGNILGYSINKAIAVNALATLGAFASCMLVIALANHWLRLAWGDLLARPLPLALSSYGRGGNANTSASPLPTRMGRGRGLGQPLSRRAALGAAGAAVVVVAGVWVGAQTINRLLAAYVARSNLAYEGMETSYTVSQATQLTPTADFYIVSKNVLDPEVIVADWQLEITGLVKQPRTWDYAGVQGLPAETRAVTFECIANGPGGHLMSTANWRGVTLAAVIAAAGGATNDAKYAIFSSVDGYQSSMPLADLLEARVLLAYEMNGERLPDTHGYPLRVVTPGRYGEQSPKWLTRIELVNYEFKGFYQSQGWSERQLTTTSRIESLTPRQQVTRGPITVRGLAFAGIRGIQKVEVSADDGVTWSQARLKPPLSDQTWVYWSWLWTPTATGPYTLVARATDGTGALQSPITTSTVPNGATGLQRIPVTVV